MGERRSERGDLGGYRKRSKRTRADARSSFFCSAMTNPTEERRTKRGGGEGGRGRTE